MLEKAEELYHSGYTSDALPYAQKAVEFSKKEFGNMRSETANAYALLGFIYYEKRMFGQARKEYSHLVRILNSIPGDNTAHLIQVYKKLADISLVFENFPRAQQTYEHIILIQKDYFGEFHQSTETSHLKLARLYSYTKSTSKIYKNLEAAINIREHEQGINNIFDILFDKHQFALRSEDLKTQLSTSIRIQKILSLSQQDKSLDIASWLHNEVTLLIKLERFNDALPQATKLLELNQKNLQNHDPLIIRTHQTLAVIYNQMARYEQAEEHLQKALKNSKLNPINKDLSKEILEALCLHYSKLANRRQELSTLQRLLTINISELGEKHPNLLENYNKLSDCLLSLKEYVRAQLILDKSYKIARDNFSDSSQQAISQQKRMIFLSYKAKRYPHAITQCKAVLKTLRAIYPETHPSFLPIFRNLTLIHQTTKSYKQASVSSLQALKCAEFINGNESLELLDDLSTVVNLYKLQQLPKKAITFAKQSVSILESHNDADKFELAEKINDLAVLYENSGNSTEAQKLYERSRSIYADAPK
ncbi:MAG: tetratricopeptide repeat protein [Lentisphaeraceae bacterium]|nr:tetratricopeptide repeat protein [Lentisphaeraceae bacterium]